MRGVFLVCLRVQPLCAHHMRRTLLLLGLCSVAFAGQAQTLFPGVTGAALRDSLLAHYKPASVLSYDRARDTLFAKLQRPQDDSLTGVYSGYTIYLDPSQDPTVDAFSKDINTEHTWPQSKGATEGTNAHSDMHHLFPARANVNSSRSNDPFGEVNDASAVTWWCADGPTNNKPTPEAAADRCSETTGSLFEPREDHKGNVARAMFYFYTMYGSQADAVDASFFTSQREVLRQWHADDPADAAEKARSQAIAPYQSNKENPFTIDPTLVDRAYFSGDDGGGGSEATDPVLNEFVADHTGSDTNEYLEIFGDPNTSYTHFTLLEIEGDATSATGRIDGVFSVGATDANGLWWTDFLDGELENGTITLLLVEGFTGANGDDLDTDDDGTLDVTPWTRLVDDVATSDGDSGDRTYSTTVLAPNFDGNSFQPGGASRTPGGTDTDTVSDWTRNNFDGDGLGGSFSGNTNQGEARNTPGTANPSGPLPVELVAFAAQAEGAGVLLRWETASEVLNAGFEVQHRAPTAAAFAAIAFVDAAGDAGRYTYRLPALPAGTHHFRLRQVDLDGRSAYSPEVTVEVAPTQPVTVALYPNPFGTHATLDFTLATEQPVRVALYDVLGREVAVLLDGFAVAGQVVRLPVQTPGLAAGTYLLRIEGLRFVAQRTVVRLP